MKILKRVSIVFMILFYITAGSYHFINPEFYLPIMPPYLGWHLQLIYIGGAFEIIFALLLILPVTRRIAAWMIIVLLIVVFPANIQMTINYFSENSPDLWISVVRLPIQLLLIWWAWSFTKSPEIKK